MSTKIITLDERFRTGEPTVQLVSTWGRNGRILREATSLHKLASDSPATDYMRTVEPMPGKTIVLIIGLGDHETYGPNRNGDGFPSEPVPGMIGPDDVLTKWYQTYDNANVFEHHVNHDPAKAIGKVLKSFWNPDMHRVEVLEYFDHDKAPHLLEKITGGEYPAKSMGCAPAGARVHTPSGHKNIEDITLGDIVITHTGAARPVTELHRRYYEGALYSVYTSNGKSTMTAEHPYAVLPDGAVKEPDGNGGLRRRAFEDIDTSHVHWIPAQDLREGMYVLTPFDVVVEETLTVDECRLLGYYCAEGHLHAGTSASVVFTHHEDDALTTELPELAARLGVRKWKSSVRKNSACARDTALRSRALFDLCNTHVGRLAGQKRLSLELMRQPLEQQLAFLGAVINGDGGTDDKDDFYISTCNEELAHQYQHMGFRCGLYSRVQTIRHRPSALVQKETTEYRVSFSRKGCNIIAPHTTKVSPRALRGASTGAMLGPGFVISKITDIVKLQFSGLVYNFEVEEDNSYVVGNHAVHNCRIKYDTCTICGNRAPTRAQYCDHLKYEMGRIYPDGKQAAALNPSPVFFDSSWVIRPADRTGYMLKKVARDHAYEIRTGSYELGELVDDQRAKAAALHKAALIEKIIAGQPEASVSGFDDGKLSVVKNYVDGVGKPLIDATKPLDAKSIRVTIEYTPADVLGTTQDMGMPLGLKELVRYFLGRLSGDTDCDDAALDSVSKHAGALFEVLAEYPRLYDDLAKVAGYDTPRYNAELAAKLAAYKVARSLDEEHMYSRVLPSSMQGYVRPNTDVLTYTAPGGQQYTTNVGLANRAAENAYGYAQPVRAAKGLGYLGLSGLLGAGALATGLRHRTLPGALAAGALAAGSIGAAAHGANKFRRTTWDDMPGPTVRADSGELMHGYTEMMPQQKHGSTKLAAELEFGFLRALDHADTLPKAERTRLLALCKTAEVRDDLSVHLGPSLDVSKVAALFQASILAHRPR